MKNSKKSIIPNLKISQYLKIIAIALIVVTLLYFKNSSYFLESILVIGVLFLIELWQISLLNNSNKLDSFKVYFQESKQSKWSIVLFSVLLIIIGFYNTSQIKLISIGHIYLGLILLFNLKYQTNWKLILEDDFIYANSFFNKQIALSSITKMKITADKELLIYYGDNKNIIPTLNEADSLDLMNRVLETHSVEILEN